MRELAPASTPGMRRSSPTATPLTASWRPLSSAASSGSRSPGTAAVPCACSVTRAAWPSPIERHPVMPTHRTNSGVGCRSDPGSPATHRPHLQREYNQHRLPTQPRPPGCQLHRGGQLVSTAAFSPAPTPDNNPCQSHSVTDTHRGRITLSQRQTTRRITARRSPLPALIRECGCGRSLLKHGSGTPAGWPAQSAARRAGPVRRLRQAVRALALGRVNLFDELWTGVRFELTRLL